MYNPKKLATLSKPDAACKNKTTKTHQQKKKTKQKNKTKQNKTKHRQLKR